MAMYLSTVCSCFSVASGPRSRPGCMPLPILSAATRASSLSVKACLTLGTTRMRLVPVQAWPVSEKPPLIARSTARSRSASSITISGFLPPSSICRRVVRCTVRWICVPAVVEPVKEIARILLELVMTGPTSPARPVTQFTTPAGTPAFSSASTRRMPDSGASDEGLNTTVLPVISAGASLRAGIEAGKFQGEITVTTPSGSRWLNTCMFGSSCG